MAFKDITIRESKGVLIADAVEEKIISNNIVVTADQINAILTQLDEEKAKYQVLLDAIKAASPATPVGAIVTP